MWFSLAGGILCYIVMSLMKNRVTDRQLWVVSVLGAVGHNVGQMGVASLVTGTVSVFLYLPVLLVSGIITGAFTGLAAQYLLRRLRLLKLF
jgi:heptaprenyl diphosphate synthase